MVGKRALKRWTADTIAELADVLSVAPRRVSEYLARGMPGKSRAYSLKESIAWCKENVWRARPVAVPADDPLMAGSDSPALERYRAARADTAELDLAVKRRQFLPLTEIREMHGVIANRYRRLSEDLERKFGSEAHQMVEACLSDIDDAVERRWGPTGDNHAG